MYSAQAGMHKVIYSFRYNDTIANGNFSTGQTVIDADNSFVIGPNSTAGRDAYLLLVNSSNVTQPSNRLFNNTLIQDVAGSRNITLAFMNVSWSGAPNNRRLTNILINGTSVWTGNALSPVNANIADFSLNRNSIVYPVNFTFNNNVVLSAFNATFGMSDNSRTTTRRLYPASNNNTFFTFEVTGSSGVTWRTLVATYNAATGNVTDCRENMTLRVFP
jgi:archaellin